MFKKICNQIKGILNVVKIPSEEREDNIIAVYRLLANQDVFIETGKGIPPIINDIKEIIGNIDIDDESEISASILEIRNKVKECHEHFLNPNVHDFLDVFRSETNLTYKAIRLALSTKNEAMEKILSSYN